MYGKDPITGTTDDAYLKNVDGTPKKHSYGKDATKFVNKESFVKTEYYIRNSQQFKDKISIVNNTGDDAFAIEGIKLEDILGADYKNQVFGKTRIGTKNNPIGTSATDFTDGTAKAVFRKDVSGNWNLHSMYPEPKN